MAEVGPAAGPSTGPSASAGPLVSLLPRQAKLWGLAGRLKLPVGLLHWGGSGGWGTRWLCRRSWGGPESLAPLMGFYAATTHPWVFSVMSGEDRCLTPSPFPAELPYPNTVFNQNVKMRKDSGEMSAAKLLSRLPTLVRLVGNDCLAHHSHRNRSESHLLSWGCCKVETIME